MFLKQARQIAVEICYRLQPYCDRINIAGSIRRRKPEVKDIEIIVQPQAVPIIDLFENIIGSQRSPEFICIVNGLGIIIKGKASDGKMMQIELREKVMLDLFIPDDFDYYRQFAIRTGSANYSQSVIAKGWVERGWCGSDKGLRKINDCEGVKQPDGTRKWKCVNLHAELPPAWQSEEHFFSWLKVKYVEPELRNL